jgi:hypothetical protein
MECHPDFPYSPPHAQHQIGELKMKKMLIADVKMVEANFYATDVSASIGVQ